MVNPTGLSQQWYMKAQLLLTWIGLSQAQKYFGLSLDSECYRNFIGAIRKATRCSNDNWRNRRKTSICNSFRSSSSFEKSPKASPPVCSEVLLIHHCRNLWWPSQIVDTSITASILDVVISNFSCFQFVLSLRNLNYSDKLKHIIYWWYWSNSVGNWYEGIIPR